MICIPQALNKHLNSTERIKASVLELKGKNYHPHYAEPRHKMPYKVGIQ